MSNWIEHLDELASVETDVKKKVAFQSSSRLIKELAKGGAELRAELAALKADRGLLVTALLSIVGSNSSDPDDGHYMANIAELALKEAGNYE
jgi:hypothetical protein